WCQLIPALRVFGAIAQFKNNGFASKQVGTGQARNSVGWDGIIGFHLQLRADASISLKPHVGNAANLVAVYQNGFGFSETIHSIIGRVVGALTTKHIVSPKEAVPQNQYGNGYHSQYAYFGFVCYLHYLLHFI